MNVAESEEVELEAMMNAEEPRCRTGSKEPSLTEHAVPEWIAATIEAPLSGGRMSSSRSIPGEV